MSPRPPAAFLTTRWTQVRQAKADSPAGRQALADLCHAYYEPILAFLRAHLRDPDAASDTAHEFFAHLLAGGGLAQAEHTHGRFRSYLLGALKHFLSHRREAARTLKRGGGTPPLSLDADTSAARTIPDTRQFSPDAAFDRQWALTTLAQAIQALQSECNSSGKLPLFEALKPWLMGDATHGAQAALAASLGLSISALKMSVQRLRQQFRHCIQAQIASTLSDPAMVQEEMRMLMAALTP